MAPEQSLTKAWTGNNGSRATFRGSHHTQHDTIQLEGTLEDGVIRYTRSREGTRADILWLALTYDESSWGRNDGENRTIYDFLHVLVTQHNVENISLALLTSSREEYNIYKRATEMYQFARVEIYLHRGYLAGPAIDRDHRHDGEVQTIRRAEISKLRNYLMLRTLRDEQHVLWQDADVFYFDEGIVPRILQHVVARHDVGVITARCALGGIENYDLNAWRGTRQGPRGWDLDQKELDGGEMELQGQYHVDKLIKNTTNDDLIALDTVGATILYMRASLIWQGLNFPDQYVVGTRWGKDGWDGIESEGICYRSRGLTGGKCMVMGGDWHVEHTSG